MRELREKVWLRRGEVREYLGLSEMSFTKLVRSGELKPKFFKGLNWAFYERTEVMKLRPEEKNKNHEMNEMNEKGRTTKTRRK